MPVKICMLKDNSITPSAERQANMSEIAGKTVETNPCLVPVRAAILK